MITRLLLRITARRPARIIHVAGKPYLIRYFVGQSAERTYYLHQFVRGDAERNIHNHPWRRSVAFVLAGGYFEERLRALCPKRGPMLDTRGIRRFRRNVITEMDFHRIVAVAPGTWTLFAHETERDHGWGFFSVSDPDADGHRRTLFHQPLRHSAEAWWKRAGCLTGSEARAQVRIALEQDLAALERHYQDAATAYIRRIVPEIREKQRALAEMIAQDGSR